MREVSHETEEAYMLPCIQVVVGGDSEERVTAVLCHMILRAAIGFIKRFPA
jgi:hypothetical protein